MGAQQSATERHTEGRNATALSIPQVNALDALASGATVTDAARRAGVDRTTVHRWLRGDYPFQAARNRLRRDLEREIEARIERLAREAVRAVEEAVVEGDARVALAVLKGVGLLSGERGHIGAEDPGQLEEEDRLATAEADGDRALRQLSVGLGG